ncbi:TetR/AcrR family transcriptional regulator [Demequina sp. SO4-18]|uniref:TetR/AcrR family transcriptional regulator n=1 Tax=Demequina sp. SO4-18 TaxID=3401026 RepID=UPI003B5AE259
MAKTTRETLSWGTLSREAIVDTALVLARERGIGAVTIRAVAEAVGCSRMALYRHVRDKTDLLDLLADEVSWAAAARAPDPGAPWESQLASIAASLREEFTANQALIEILIGNAVEGRGGVRVSEQITRAIASTGLPPERVAHYCLVFTDVVLGRIQREARGDPTTPARNKRLIDAAVASDEAPTVRRYASYLRAVDPGEVFEAEVNMVCAAIHEEIRSSPVQG